MKLLLDRWNRSDHLTNSTQYQQMVAALYNYNWCNSNYSQDELDAADAEITSTQATIALLQSQIAEDQAEIQNLQTSSGADSLDIQIAQAQLDNAEAQSGSG